VTPMFAIIQQRAMKDRAERRDGTVASKGLHFINKTDNESDFSDSAAGL